MTLMSYDQQIAFIDAVQDVYGIDLEARPREPILKGMVHYGVYTGAGEPVTLHTLDPNDDSRVLMQNDVEKSVGVSTNAGAYE
jgi:hypothetical protein